MARCPPPRPCLVGAAICLSDCSRIVGLSLVDLGFDWCCGEGRGWFCIGGGGEGSGGEKGNSGLRTRLGFFPFQSNPIHHSTIQAANKHANSK